MRRSKSICLALSLLSCAACSTANKAPPSTYVGIPASLMERCVVQDVAMNTTGDIVVSRGLYKEGFEKCAAKVDAIRKFDAEARAASE